MTQQRCKTNFANQGNFAKLANIQY